jgi:predicted enzyme related to lactoylglutathione lyase
MTTTPSPRIVFTSVHVDDQTKALAFYTDVLGFRLKHDVPLGEHRWLTVVSPEDPDGVELVLEPDDHPAARAYQAALSADGIPVNSFAVADVRAAVSVLEQRGVRVVSPPTEMGPVVAAVIDDTCGNLLQLTSPAQGS